MLKVENLNFGYNGIPVLSDISFHVEKGQLCGLFGPNGCGKTTLFKCCLKFLKPERGRVLIDGGDSINKRIEEMAKLVAYVPQEHKPPFPYLVKEVVLMGRTPHLGGVFGISNEDKKKVLEALKLLEITDIANKPYNQLSGGQRQLVPIARAVAQEPKLLLLDEPTSALDFSNQIRIWKILIKIKQKGTTILACSHDPNHVLWFCDKVFAMTRNGLIANGTPEHVISEEILDEMYQDICSVGTLDGLKMVFPKDLANGCLTSKGQDE